MFLCQSFADLWVDFLLKETEERERRELADNGGRSKEDSHGIGSNAAVNGPPVANQTTNSAGTASSFSRSNLSPGQNSSQFPSHGNFRHSEHFDSEFSTVPLTSSDNTQQISRLLPKY
jgi:hypothetical protein